MNANYWRADKSAAMTCENWSSQLFFSWFSTSYRCRLSWKNRLTISGIHFQTVLYSVDEGSHYAGCGFCYCSLKKFSNVIILLSDSMPNSLHRNIDLQQKQVILSELKIWMLSITAEHADPSSISVGISKQCRKGWMLAALYQWCVEPTQYFLLLKYSCSENLDLCFTCWNMGKAPLVP